MPRHKTHTKERLIEETFRQVQAIDGMNLAEAWVGGIHPRIGIEVSLGETSQERTKFKDDYGRGSFRRVAEIPLKYGKYRKAIKAAVEAHGESPKKLWEYVFGEEPNEEVYDFIAGHRGLTFICDQGLVDPERKHCALHIHPDDPRVKAKELRGCVNLVMPTAGFGIWEANKVFDTMRKNMLSSTCSHPRSAGLLSGLEKLVIG